ncbi:hypothetical protein NL676_039838 [Syzygium grande]|nr:hypothetical protein NL676_039838 [Syzygium grande]
MLLYGAHFLTICSSVSFFPWSFGADRALVLINDASLSRIYSVAVSDPASSKSDMVEAAATAAAVEAYRDGKSLIAYVGRKINCANDLEKNFRRLTEEAEKLFARRDDVEAEANKDKTKKKTKECEAWIGRVKNVENEVQELENEFRKRRKRSWKQRHILSAPNFSKRLAEKCEELHSLWAEGGLETEAVVERPPEPVRLMHAPKTEDKPSIHCAVEEILGYLRDCSVK